MKDYDESVKPGEIWVTDFEPHSAINFKKDLFALFDENPSKPIIIHINSEGGRVDGLFLMLDAMDAIRTLAHQNFKLITSVSGCAMSAGAVLLSHGDIRFATSNASIMVHQVSSCSWGSKPDIDVEYKETARVNDQVLDILVKNCNIPGGVKEAKKIFSRNVYFTPQKAKRFGLIDGIGYPKINELKLYELVICGSETEKSALKKQMKQREKSRS